MSEVFDGYARYYELLYRDKDYAAEAKYVADRIRRHAPHAARILELGCGTGAHAEQLARMGFRVHGVDVSEAMLSRSRARTALLGADLAQRLSFERGDVRTVRRGEPFDAVISLFHVMSYQTGDADVAATFATAAAHLRRTGLFLFDFWYGPAVLAQGAEVRVKRLADDTVDVTRIAEPVMRERDHVIQVNYTVFIEEKASGRIERVRESHPMRYFTLPELAAFGRAAFEQRESLAWLSDAAPDAQSWSGFQVLARRAD
jgi:SAM-dependent methyltransferase